MSEMLTIVMQCKAYGAQGPRQYMHYGEGMSIAQRSNAREERIERAVAECRGLHVA